MTIDALLFDVGTVLIHVDFHKAFAHWAAAAGTTPDALAARFRPDAAYEAHERGEISAAEYYASLRKSLGIDLPDAVFHEGWCGIFGGTVPGITELLTAQAADLPVYLFSNTNAAHYARWRPLYPALLAPVSRVFCSHELGLRKPSVEAYAAVCGQLGLAPDRIAFFDDLPENVAGARAAGLHAFHVTTFDDTRRAVAAARSGRIAS